ncbi:DoxX family protein [Bacteriovorax sp. BSW11_IV]|uniref:MauE/DoxX family redox-associated membrane protein n=1 Tax=Bacteriovorax sp. BSW11_IV TaxID=1353529 RepID=UPI00038A139E|nr:MauE/DoxX family redox-associated membrane protein [Bacteriovorax sp. BSW11_IV]EQC48729.1 DoxX family protein [Bacteriovorax sp. BSW11_IV]
MTLKKGLFHFIRMTLAITYFWVVADRLGFLGPAGNVGVVWGDFDKFLEYTATLNPWFPRGLSDFLGYVVTIVEVILGILLISNNFIKYASLASVLLLIIFTLSMTFSLGITEAYDFIIFTVILGIGSGILYKMSL